ncbi:hypothetical protein A8950_1044 [Dongia mobilis]|uniref:Uncharacterized protein n=1 Tax=Dongia mobilis TaxID=578943 RepID=A0A4R6WXQ9_9PROT|nr:hypothetical protein A8950_1044 [Dongia mobilis]
MPVLWRLYSGQYHLLVQEWLTATDFPVKSHKMH